MNIIIKTKNIDASDSLNGFIEKKFAGLEKFVNFLKKEDGIGKTLDEIFVEVEKETKHHKKGDIFCVKAQIILPGKSLMVNQVAEDLFKAVIKARDELKTEIEKYKLKNVEKNRRQRRKTSKT